jgi:hypothetical protein
MMQHCHPALSLQPLKNDTACFSETSAQTYKSTRRQYPRLQQRGSNRRENLKFHPMSIKIDVTVLKNAIDMDGHVRCSSLTSKRKAHVKWKDTKMAILLNGLMDLNWKCSWHNNRRANDEPRDVTVYTLQQGMSVCTVQCNSDTGTWEKVLYRHRRARSETKHTSISLRQSPSRHHWNRKWKTKIKRSAITQCIHHIISATVKSSFITLFVEHPVLAPYNTSCLPCQKILKVLSYNGHEWCMTILTDISGGESLGLRNACSRTSPWQQNEQEQGQRSSVARQFREAIDAFKPNVPFLMQFKWTGDLLNNAVA